MALACYDFAPTKRRPQDLVNILTRLRLWSEIRLRLRTDALTWRDRTLRDARCGAIARQRRADKSWTRLSLWLEQERGSPLRTVRLRLLLVLAGLLGAGTMSGLLGYSGARPVNLVWPLLLFGPLQWLLLVVAGVMLLLRPMPRLPLLLRLVPQPGAASTLPARTLAIAVFWANQLLAVTFLLGAVVALPVIIAVQDVAFGWSTTLQLDEARIATILQALAGPWAALWPEAVPSRQLLADTQFFRLGNQSAQLNVEVFGEWWRFLLAWLVVWGIGPRLLALAIAHSVLQRAVMNGPRQDVMLAALLQRMDGDAGVDSGSDVRESGALLTQTEDGEMARLTTLPAQLRTWGLEAGDFSRIGIDTAAFDRIELNDADEDFRWPLAVPGWEPPLGELADLIRHCPSGSIEVVLLPLAEGLTDGDLQSWQAFAAAQPAIERLVLFDAADAVSAP